MGSGKNVTYLSVNTLSKVQPNFFKFFEPAILQSSSFFIAGYPN